MHTLSSVMPLAASFTLRRPLHRTLLLMACCLSLSLPAFAQTPVAWWTGSDTAQDGVGDAGGTLQGGVGYGPGVLGHSFSFDGTGGGVLIPDVDSLKLTKSISITAYVYAKSYPNPAGFIFFRGDSRGGLDPYNVLLYQKALAFTIYDDHGGAIGLNSNVPFPLYQWVFIAATLDDKTGRMSLYFDGTPVGTLTTTIRPFRDLDPNFQPGSAIGNYQNGFGAPFHGYIDDLKVYDQVVDTTPPLSLSRVRPATIAPGSGDTVLAVGGFHFSTRTVVRWNNIKLPTQYVSFVGLTATVPASLLAQAGTAKVTAHDPATGKTSNVKYIVVGP